MPQEWLSVKRIHLALGEEAPEISLATNFFGRVMTWESGRDVLV